LSTAVTREPPLIPRPARFEYGAGDFPPGAATAIALGPEAGDETVFAARQFQAAVRDAVGLELPLRRGHDLTGGENRVALLLAGRDGAGPEPGLVAEGLGAEGYALRVAPERVTVVAGGEAGLFYGVQTLRQFLRTQGRRLPALTIADRPVLAHRHWGDARADE